MSYGVLQEHYFDHWNLKGGRELTGIIETISNGAMHLSMPFLFALFTKTWARFRSHVRCASRLCQLHPVFVQQTHLHLIITQGVLAAMGCALAFSPLTLSLGEWFST